MKYTIGIMACIAIAFLFVTSPDKHRSHAQEEIASVAPQPAGEQKLDQKLDSIIDLLHNQDIKIDQVDSLATDMAIEQVEIQQRLVALETKATEPQPTPADPVKAEVDACCDCNCEDLERRVAALEQVKSLLSRSTSSGGSVGSVVYGPVVASSGYGSAGSSVVNQPVRSAVGTVVRSAAAVATAPVRAAANYQPRWQNYDGKPRMQHAVEEHGMDISGQSQAQVLAEMDAYHDKYGPGHPVRSSAPVRSNVANSNCLGGVCLTGPSVQTRSSGGWYLGRAFRR